MSLNVHAVIFCENCGCAIYMCPKLNPYTLQCAMSPCSFAQLCRVVHKIPCTKKLHANYAQVGFHLIEYNEVLAQHKPMYLLVAMPLQ